MPVSPAAAGRRTEPPITAPLTRLSGTRPISADLRCGRAGEVDRAFAVLDQMVSAGLKPNVVTYTALLDACAKASQLPRAIDVFRSMIAARVPPMPMGRWPIGCWGCMPMPMAARTEERARGT